MKWFRKRKSERPEPVTVQVTVRDPFSGIRVETWTIGKEIDSQSYNRLKDADGKLWGITAHRENGQIDGSIILKEEFDKLEAGIVPPEILRRMYSDNKAKAENGDAAGQKNLGLLYLKGMGVDIDESKAAHWFNLAARQGNAEAQDYLGGMYALGKGTNQDLVLAYTWLSLAGENGRSQALEMRELVASQMKPFEIRQAEEVFDSWVASQPDLLDR